MATSNRAASAPAAVVEDAESTWRFRRLEDMSRWLTRAPGSLAEYRSQFTEPASLAKSLVIELDGAVIGDLMVGDGWAQAEVLDRASVLSGIGILFQLVPPIEAWRLGVAALDAAAIAIAFVALTSAAGPAGTRPATRFVAMGVGRNKAKG